MRSTISENGPRRWRLGLLLGGYLGRCPRLIWFGPLARVAPPGGKNNGVLSNGAGRKRQRTGAVQDATARSAGSRRNACAKREGGLSMNRVAAAVKRRQL